MPAFEACRHSGLEELISLGAWNRPSLSFGYSYPITRLLRARALRHPVPLA
jgi:hypothetical protein